MSNQKKHLEEVSQKYPVKNKQKKVVENNVVENRFSAIKRSVKKPKDIDEKIEYLEKECQKTGLNEVTMSVTGIYQKPTSVPNQDYNDFNGLNQGGYGLGLSGDDGNSLGNAIVGDHPYYDLSGVALSPPHPITGVRSVASTVTSGTGSNRALRPGIGTRSTGTPPRIIKDGSALWFWDPNYSLGGTQGIWRNFEWLDGQLGFWDTNFLGFYFFNTNLDQYELNGVNIGTQIKNMIAGINFGTNGGLGPPETVVLFKSDLGDPGFTPVDVLSSQGYNRLRELAEEDLIAAEYPKKDIWDNINDALKKQSDALGPGFPSLKDADDPYSFSRGHGRYNSYEPEGDLISEAVKLGYFDPKVLNVDIEDIRKGIVPEFPKDEPEMIGGYSAKSRLVRKDPKFPPYLKVTRKDLARNHNLTDKEIITYLNEIKMINAYIKKNPSALAYVMIRYPKDDPRLAQLNFKLDQMKRASDKYIDKQFPENKKLFDKLQDKIKQNIELTDPKNFIDHKRVPTFVDTMKEQKKMREKKKNRKWIKSMSRNK